MNKKQLYEAIMSSVAKEVKKSLYEYRVAKPKEDKNFEITEKDVQKWLKKTISDYLENKLTNDINVKFGDRYSYSATLMFSACLTRDYHNNIIENEYSCRIYIGNFRYYEDKRSMRDTELFEQLEYAYKYLKCHEEFKITAAPLKTALEINFRYYLNKDEELYNAIEAAKNQFEQDVQAEAADEYAPTRRDWEKMIGYMNGHSNPERVAKSCKDYNKIVARYIIAKSLGWDEAVNAFKFKIKSEHILTDAQLEAYTRKYATYNMPEEYAELISDMKEFDATGGLATNDELKILPDNAKRYLHNNRNIASYTIEPLDEEIPVKRGSFNRRVHIHNYYDTGIKCKQAEIRITTIDGNVIKLYYAYKRQTNNCVYISKYRLNSVDYDDYRHTNSTTALHHLQALLEPDNN